MFTIDLLRGQCVPEQTKPEKIIAIAITIALPVIVSIIMFGWYMSSKVAISVLTKETHNCQSKIDEVASSLVEHRKYEMEKQLIGKCMNETASVINRNTQWSDILVTMVQNIPDSLVLTRLTVEQRNAKVKIDDRNKPGEKIEVVLPAKTLHMNLGAIAGDNADEDVRDFRDKLRRSDVFGPKLEDILVSQHVDVMNDREVISYEMKCIFKPQI